VDGKGLGSC